MAADLSARQFSPPKTAPACCIRPARLARRRPYANHRNRYHGGRHHPGRHARSGFDQGRRSGQVSLLRHRQAFSRYIARRGAHAGYSGRGRRRADPARHQSRRPRAPGIREFPHGSDRSLRARPHVGQSQRRPARDDFARRVRAHRTHAVGQPRRRALFVQDRAERPVDGRSPRRHSGRAARSPCDRLPRVQSAHYPRSGSGHHVSQSHQPHCPDRRGDRRRHGHVRAPPAEDGQHRGHEIAGSNVGRDHPHLHHPDPDAGPAGRDRRRPAGPRRGGSIPLADQQDLRDQGHHRLALRCRRPGDCGRTAHHVAVHVAAAGGDPQDSTGDDPAPWHGGSETALAKQNGRRARSGRFWVALSCSVWAESPAGWAARRKWADTSPEVYSSA